MDPLEWPTVQRRHRKARLEMFFKAHHGLITISSSYLPRPTSSRCSFRKNSDCSRDITSCWTQYRQRSFFPRTLPDLNSLPQEIMAAYILDYGWWWWLFSRLRGFWETVRPFIPRQRFFKMEISSRTQIPLFRPGSVCCGSASWDDCDQVFTDKVRVWSFPDRVPHYA